MLHTEIIFPDTLLSEIFPLSLNDDAILHKTTLRYDLSTNEGGQEVLIPIGMFYGATETWMY